MGWLKNPIKALTGTVRHPIQSATNTMMAPFGGRSKRHAPLNPSQGYGAPAQSIVPYNSRNASELAPEQLAQEIEKVIARDSAKLATTNYPVYKGATVSPMSSATQRSRELKEKFASKPAPYSNKIQSVLGRNPQGFTPEMINTQLDMLKNAQTGFTNDKIVDTLQKQFGNPYSDRVSNFTQKTDKSLNRNLGEAQNIFQNLGKEVGILEGNRNRLTAQNFQNLQQQKQNRRGALTGTLEQFGDQKHAYNNLVNEANRNQFNLEVNEPQRKLQMLQEAISPNSGGYQPGLQPDLDKHQGQQLVQALRAYGIDPTKSIDQWETQRSAPSRYPGQLVAPLPAEINSSHKLLEGLNPSMKDNYSQDRKALEKGLLSNSTLTDTAMQKVPESMRGTIVELESAAKKRLKNDLAAINNNYIRLGQYGSEQHKAAAESRARDINKSTLEQRNKLLQNAIKDQTSLQYGSEINDIKKLGLLGTQSHNEFNNILNDVIGLNKLGATKWKNNQAEQEELYKNYENERNWAYPHMRGSTRRAPLNEIFQGRGERDISLDRVPQLDTRYSELEKELATRNQEINNEREYWQQKQSTLEAEKAGLAMHSAQQEENDAYQRWKNFEGRFVDQYGRWQGPHNTFTDEPRSTGMYMKSRDPNYQEALRLRGIYRQFRTQNMNRGTQQ